MRVDPQRHRRAGNSEGKASVCRWSAATMMNAALMNAALMLFLTGCSGGSDSQMPAPRTVLIQVVGPAPASGARFAGELRAADRSDLAFEISGLVTRVSVDLGDEFEAGDVLAEVDSRQPRLDLTARRANLNDAEATLTDAQLDYERRSTLGGSGAIAQSAIDQAKARFESARAQVEALRAEVGRAEERLADTRLVAPFNGEVVARLAEPSEVVTAGRAVLRVIGDQSSIEAVVSVPGRVRARLTRGQNVGVQSTGRDLMLDGVITEVGAEANVAGLFPITIAISDPDDTVRPGESVEVQFLHSTAERALLIPLTAYVAEAAEDASVFVVKVEDGKSKVVRRRVTLGALRDDGVEVLSGLSEGEQIVVKGVELLTDGQPVRTAGVGIARFNQ